MTAQENYKNRQEAAKTLKRRSAYVAVFAVVALLIGLEDLFDGQETEYLGWVGKNLGPAGTVGVPALLLAGVVGALWWNNRAVKKAKVAADAELAREKKK